MLINKLKKKQLLKIRLHTLLKCLNLNKTGLFKFWTSVFWSVVVITGPFTLSDVDVCKPEVSTS